MRKAQFIYTKEEKSGETPSNREILNPIFLKESANSLKDYNKVEVKYLQGYQLDKEGLTEDEQTKYIDTLESYINLQKPTMEEYFQSIGGLDHKKFQFKTFKKSG